MSDQTTPTQASDVTTKADQIATEVEQITGAIAKISTATAWTAIVGFFTALPGLIALIQNFMSWVNSVSGNNPQAFISNLGLAMAQLKSAKTKEDRDNAAKTISDLIHKLPS